MDGNLYRDIEMRTGGEIHIGVIGPVRTGKSTLIKRFMELFVVPGIENPYVRTRVVDQLPQSGDGRTITTTEPKFVPEEAVNIKVSHADLSLRMVDCVGYLIPGVLGHLEDGTPRMVKTPWDKESMPFEEAAAKGTEKVIREHSTVGILVTTDGSIGELPRENYVQAEEKTVLQLKALGKPFVIVLNSINPRGEMAVELAGELEQKYQSPVICANCSIMEKDVPEKIFAALLAQFPVEEIFIDLPDYMEALSAEHPIKASLVDTILNWMSTVDCMHDVEGSVLALTANQHIRKVFIDRMEMSTGRVYLDVQLKDGLYYQIMGELLGQPVTGDRELFLLLKDYADAKAAYDDMADALYRVNHTGYGIVHPKLHQMELGKPEVFKQGNKYGVRMVASAPCLHMIKTTVNTEISPIVGSQQQSEDLVKYLMEKFEGDTGDDMTEGDAEHPGEGEDIWDTNLFGKTLKELVTEQMNSKLTAVPDTLQFKVQRSLQKISNEGKDYFICIIL